MCCELLIAPPPSPPPFLPFPSAGVARRERAVSVKDTMCVSCARGRETRSGFLTPMFLVPLVPGPRQYVSHAFLAASPNWN